MGAASHAFRIVNVFTVDGDRLSGNPLCVFEDARGLADAQMQALARQLNLSETTFVLPPSAGVGPTRACGLHPGFKIPVAAPRCPAPRPPPPRRARAAAAAASM